MPLTQLDPVPALVVIDLQKGIVALPTAEPMAEIVGRAARLAHAFRERGFPIALVNVSGMAPGRTDMGRRTFAFPHDWTDLVPELDRQPEDLAITKERVGAFIGTRLDDELRARGVTQIFLVGVATGSGVESTARSAYDLGYNVVFVTDAMTDLSAEIHRHCIDLVFPKLGETCSTQEAVQAVEKGLPSESSR